jgi:hypothetical protein
MSTLKIKLIISFLLITATITAQDNEPEFIGEINVVYNDSVKPLDKEYMATKTNADASLVLFGLGSVRSSIVVKGKGAKVRIPENTQFSLIAKCVDNNSDPMSVVRIFQFAVHSGSRKAEAASSDVFGNTNKSLNNVKYSAKKYGTSSYNITFSSLPIGEYGVLVYNPNNRDGKAILIYCFGVGKPKKYSGWLKYGNDDVY